MIFCRNLIKFRKYRQGLGYLRAGAIGIYTNAFGTRISIDPENISFYYGLGSELHIPKSSVTCIQLRDKTFGTIYEGFTIIFNPEKVNFPNTLCAEWSAIKDSKYYGTSKNITMTFFAMDRKYVGEQLSNNGYEISIEKDKRAWLDLE
jgi:hypothetical protein